MKANILVYSKSVAGGEKSLNLSTLFFLCKKTGFELENFVIKSGYDFALTESLLNDGALIILCEKKDMEVFEINLSYKFSSEREIVFGDCVRLFSGMNVIFIPIEGEFYEKIEDFLKLSNENNKTSIFRLFGKTQRFIEKKMAEAKLPLENIVVDGHGLLSDIFVSVPKDQFGVSEIEKQLGSLFMDDIYSDSELSIKDVVTNLLKSHNCKIDIVDTFTCGAIASLFCDNVDVLYESLSPIEDRALISEAKMNGVNFKEYGSCSVETNSLICKSRLAEQGANLIVVVTGEKCEEGYKEILSIADRKSINSIKTTFYGNKQDAVEFTKNWVLFNLIKKLRKKDFEIMT